MTSLKKVYNLNLYVLLKDETTMKGFRLKLCRYNPLTYKKRIIIKLDLANALSAEVPFT